MGTVVPFQKPNLAKIKKGKTFCASNLHQWEVAKDNQFDVKQGKLVTLYRCKNCGKTKIKAH